MFLSAVTNSSKPAASAALSKSPLLSLSHPRSTASTITWPFSAYRKGAGVLWSNRMSIYRRCRRGLRGVSIETSRRKFKHGYNLFPVQVEPLHDLVNGGPGFEVFKHNRNRHPGILKHPCAAHLAGNALHGGTLGPIKSCHILCLLS